MPNSTPWGHRDVGQPKVGRPRSSLQRHGDVRVLNSVLSYHAVDRCEGQEAPKIQVLVLLQACGRSLGVPAPGGEACNPREINLPSLVVTGEAAIGAFDGGIVS